ncbi:MAG: SDR family NAD(P)-dependent oxidoreductase [Polyangiaceae bacterium]|nr:SDR family NAD(P)-dependent oxidoreductase [Polyangiaceae bacterium]
MGQILIFGASSTVALACAKIWARRGDEFILVARTRERLTPKIQGLRNSVLAEYFQDLGDCGENQALVDEIFLKYPRIDKVFIAHGYLGGQAESENTWQEAEKQICVNYMSVVSLLHPCADHLSARGKGQIAVLTSVAGQRGRPRNYTYGSAKGGLSIFLQGLRSRLWPRIAVTDLVLGPVDTPMTKDHRKNFSFATAESAALKIVSAVDRRVSRAFVPGYWRWVCLLVRLMPEAVFQRLKFLRD